MTFYAILLGVVFVGCVCALFVFLARFALQGWRATLLKESGRQIIATVIAVGEYDESPFGYRPRGLGPKRYYVTAIWKDGQTNKEYTFQQRGLFHQPHYSTGDTLSVLINPQNPHRYFMQLNSF